MANICCVDHTFFAEDESGNDQLMLLWAHLVANNEAYKNDEKSVLWHALESLTNADAIRGVFCRSRIDTISRDVDRDIVEVGEETANAPCEEAWDLLLTQFPGVGHSWVASEPGCCFYKKRDPGEFYLDRTRVVRTDMGPDDWPFGVEYYSDEEWMTALRELCPDLPEKEGMTVQEALDIVGAVAVAKGFDWEVFDYEEV